VAAERSPLSPAAYAAISSPHPPACSAAWTSPSARLRGYFLPHPFRGARRLGPPLPPVCAAISSPILRRCRCVSRREGSERQAGLPGLPAGRAGARMAEDGVRAGLARATARSPKEGLGGVLARGRVLYGARLVGLVLTRRLVLGADEPRPRLGLGLGLIARAATAISTSLRPFVLATYRARSALRTSWSPSRACWGIVAIPTLGCDVPINVRDSDFGDGRAELLADTGGALGIGIGQQHDEFIAAVSPDEVAGPHGHGQRGRQRRRERRRRVRDRNRR